MRRNFAAAALALFIASSASAQLVNGRWQAPPKGSSAGGGAVRQGVEVKPAAPPVVQSHNRGGGYTVTPLRVVAAVLMSNGAVMADFGYGLEAVGRNCGINAAYTPLRVVTIQKKSDLQPVPGMQPAPQMQPAPGQTVREGTPAIAHGVRSNAARASCFVHVTSRGWFATY